MMTKEQYDSLHGLETDGLTTNPNASDPSKQHKLTRKERREFKRKLKKPKYQKLAKKIIESKNK